MNMTCLFLVGAILSAQEGNVPEAAAEDHLTLDLRCHQIEYLTTDVIPLLVRITNVQGEGVRVDGRFEVDDGVCIYGSDNNKDFAELDLPSRSIRTRKSPGDLALESGQEVVVRTIVSACFRRGRFSAPEPGEWCLKAVFKTPSRALESNILTLKLARNESGDDSQVNLTGIEKWHEFALCGFVRDTESLKELEGILGQPKPLRQKEYFSFWLGARAQWRIGRVQPDYDKALRYLSIAAQGDVPYMKAESLYMMAQCHYAKGDGKAALECLNRLSSEKLDVVTSIKKGAERYKAAIEAAGSK